MNDCEGFGMDRRMLMAAIMSVVVGAEVVPGARAEEQYEAFFGTAAPPTSYGGYGGNAEEDAKYTFEYPAGWKPSVPNKTEKGTQGIDCRITNPRNKGQTITVITFGRAGEDNKSFRVTDIDLTIQGFAGADYDLQDALSMESNRVNTEREVEGSMYYDVEIDSPDVTYLLSVTVKYGKVFALFVKSPTRSFTTDQEKLRHVVETFKTL
eukprot:CAMPEP_0118797714 /NCGR_PEP_ID=MMETSP1161-20130426/212_1 /TAXON_ID=249345 /ORGANISM="Picochlorum oklahomensis, Strain CCMP2329" /LENGTH=208 /DNA_ID=CAMNT_0006724927 /DNA_START=143 /DNA_END=772 /DNA_ORIENTATION=+